MHLHVFLLQSCYLGMNANLNSALAWGKSENMHTLLVGFHCGYAKKDKRVVGLQHLPMPPHLPPFRALLCSLPPSLLDLCCWIIFSSLLLFAAYNSLSMLPTLSRDTWKLPIVFDS